MCYYCDPTSPRVCEFCEEPIPDDLPEDIEGTGLCSYTCMRGRALFWDPDLAAYEDEDEEY